MCPPAAARTAFPTTPAACQPPQPRTAQACARVRREGRGRSTALPVGLDEGDGGRSEAQARRLSRQERDGELVLALAIGAEPAERPVELHAQQRRTHMPLRLPLDDLLQIHNEVQEFRPLTRWHLGRMLSDLTCRARQWARPHLRWLLLQRVARRALRTVKHGASRL